jgi:hypothetical protein
MTETALADDALQELCEEGQRLLMRTEYLDAEAALARAERQAWAARDWDTLSRLYMPLQECRRQRRQRCGEGIVRLDLIAGGPDDRLDAEAILASHPHGQLLVAGWGDAGPAARVRELAAERKLYVETFLAAVYPVATDESPADQSRVVVLVPAADVHLPDPTPRTKVALYALLPPQALALPARELPAGDRRGGTETYADVMSLWEKLHRPFLTAANAEPDLVRRMAAYRTTLTVDYACELAHQKLSAAAQEMARR